MKKAHISVKKEKLRLWAMLFFQFSGFFQMMAISVMNLFPLFWLSLGYSERTIGLLNGFGMITAILGPFFFGWIGSHKAPSRIIALCFLLTGLATPLMLLSTHVVAQTFLFGLSQFLKVGFLTLVPVGVLHLLGERAGLDYGRYRRAGSAGFLIAGFAGYLIQQTNPSIAVWLVAGACVLAAIPFLGKIQIPLIHAPEEGWIDLFRDRKTFYFLLGSMLLSTWNAGVWVFLPLRMRELGASPNLIAWTMAECGLIAMLTLTKTGRIVDRIKHPAMIFLLVPVAAGLRLWLMALPQTTPEWFVLIQGMHVLVWVLGEIVQIQFVRHYTKPSLFPRVQAMLQVGTYAGMGAASVVMGLLVEPFGIRDTLTLSALMPLLAIPFLWLALKAVRRENLHESKVTGKLKAH